MGTQQILLVVLSLIVVGAAVSVGIIMFDTQAKNQARNALTTEGTSFAVQAQAWFMTPRVLKGGEGTFESSDLDSLLRFINNGETGYIRTPAGVYTITAESGITIRLVGISSTQSSVYVMADVNLDGSGSGRGIVWHQ